VEGAVDAVVGCVSEAEVRDAAVGERIVVVMVGVRWRRVLAVLVAVCGLAVALVGCAPSVPGGGQTPTVVSTAETFVVASEMADVMDADAPQGWTVIPQDPDPGMDYLASEDGSRGFTAASIRATRIPGDVLYSADYVVLGERDVYDLDAIVRGTRYRATRQSSVNREASPVQERMIGGSPARGFSYIHTRQGVDMYYEVWLVGRHDGLWRITLTSAPGQTSLPEGLADEFLDSITWTKPATTPATTPAASASSS